MGNVSTIIAGIGMMIVAVVILFVVISTIGDSDLLDYQESRARTDNETGAAGATETMGAWINTTPYRLANANVTSRDYSIIIILNATGDFAIPSANYTLNSTGSLVAATLTNYSSVNISYYYTAKGPYEESFRGMTENFTVGIGNVSSKIPTVLLIAAVVLLFGILILLIIRAREMTGFVGAGRRKEGFAGKSISGEGPTGSL